MYWTSLLKRDKIDGLLFSQETEVAWGVTKSRLWYQFRSFLRHQASQTEGPFEASRAFHITVIKNVNWMSSMMPSEFLQHSCIPSSQLKVIMSPWALWDSVAQSDSVSRLDLVGAWVTEREDHFTPVRSHSHPAWALKDTHQGTSLCPTACLATTTPVSISSVYVYECMYTPLSFSLPSALRPYPSSTPEVSFVSDLHSKRNPFDISAHDWDSEP